MTARSAYPRNLLRGGAMALAGALLILHGGCKLWPKAPALPVRNSLVLDQLVIFSDSPLPAQSSPAGRADRSARRTEHQAGAADFRRADSRLFVSHEPQFKAFMGMHYPDFPDRRAFFVESDTRLMVYAYWGDRVAEDLRHEVAHGYLHATCRTCRCGSTKGWPNILKCRAAIGASTGRTCKIERGCWPRAGRPTCVGWKNCNRPAR